MGKMQLILSPTLNFSSIGGHKNESSVNIRTHKAAFPLISGQFAILTQLVNQGVRFGFVFRARWHGVAVIRGVWFWSGVGVQLGV